MSAAATPFITPRRVVLASLGVWTVCVLLQWLTNPPLSHDESAYAMLARDGQHTWLYRPIGMVVLGRIGIWLGGGELALRAASVVLGLGLVPAVARLGRRFGAWTGAWAAALIAGSHAFLLRGFQLLNDIPATVCIVLAAAIVVEELERPEGPSYRLVGTAPLFAIALYLRYGSALVIAVLSFAAVVVWWRSLLRRQGPPLLATGVFALLITPLLLYSLDKTGSVTGVFELSRDAATYATGTGLRRFVLSNPFMFYGALLPPVMIAGLISVLPLNRDRAFLVLVAVTIIVWLGLFSDGSARFLFVPVIFLVIAGVHGITRVVAARPQWRRLIVRGAGALVLAAWLAMIGAAIPIQRHIARGLSGMMTASAAIRQDAAGRPCIVTAFWVTELMWYSGCAGAKAPRWDNVQGRLPPDARWYAASMPHHPVDPGAVSRAVGATSTTALPGGTAWRLEHE